MQSEIINEIIEVEDKATLTVEKARSDASVILNNADIKAKQIVKDSLKQCKSKNQIKFDKLVEENKKEVMNYQESLKSDYSASSFDYKKVAKQLAQKICSSSVFEA
ncbi:MAG: hypothetical protein ACRQFF_13705 [Sphaerochaeta sp.]|jgi:vacuolar-type H+-ATPase subunit H